MREIYVAVCGPALASPVESGAAEQVGRLLARAGAIVVTGGLGGVMAAASKGAKDAGGTVVAILPGDRHDEANPHSTVSVPTGMGEARNAVLVRCADAVIAIGGEFGTLSEIALARKLGLTVVGMDTWDAHRMGGGDADIVRRARGADDAVRLALTAARERAAARL